MDGQSLAFLPDDAPRAAGVLRVVTAEQIRSASCAQAALRYSVCTRLSLAALCLSSLALDPLCCLVAASCPILLTACASLHARASCSCTCRGGEKQPAVLHSSCLRPTTRSSSHAPEQSPSPPPHQCRPPPCPPSRSSCSRSSSRSARPSPLSPPPLTAARSAGPPAALPRPPQPRRAAPAGPQRLRQDGALLAPLSPARRRAAAAAAHGAQHGGERVPPGACRPTAAALRGLARAREVAFEAGRLCAQRGWPGVCG